MAWDADILGKQFPNLKLTDKVYNPVGIWNAPFWIISEKFTGPKRLSIDTQKVDAVKPGPMMPFLLNYLLWCFLGVFCAAGFYQQERPFIPFSKC